MRGRPYRLTMLPSMLPAYPFSDRVLWSQYRPNTCSNSIKKEFFVMQSSRVFAGQLPRRGSNAGAAALGTQRETQAETAS